MRCVDRCSAGVLARTRFGSRLRASVDDPRVAAGLGIDVNLVFCVTFAVGSGLAGLGGALGAEILGLDPTFPLKFMIYFLIVVSVGGTTTITGPLARVAAARHRRRAGKYYVPKLGAFIVYTVMIVILILRPQGLFARGRRRNERDAEQRCARSARWRAWELALLAALPLSWFVLPVTRCSQRDRDPRAVRRVARPDPGLRRHRLARPCGILRHGRLRGGVVRQARDARSAGRPGGGRRCGGAARRWLSSVLVMRGSDLTRLMVTLGVALILFELANKLEFTGGADGLQGVVIGPLLGRFEFDLAGRTALAYSLVLLVICCWSRAASSHRRSAGRCRRSATTVCAPRRSASTSSAPGRGLHHRRSDGRRGGGPARADHRFRLARRAGLPPLAPT